MQVALAQETVIKSHAVLGIIITRDGPLMTKFDSSEKFSESPPKSFISRRIVLIERNGMIGTKLMVPS